jgi:hypothetical protein
MASIGNCINESHMFFMSFLDVNNILLDGSFENSINSWTYTDENVHEVVDTMYFNLFSSYYDKYSTTINFIYYIIMLWYVPEKKLKNFICFMLSKMRKHIGCSDTILTKLPLSRQKAQLITTLKSIIDDSECNLLIFMYLFQLYM